MATGQTKLFSCTIFCYFIVAPLCGEVSTNLRATNTPQRYPTLFFLKTGSMDDITKPVIPVSDSRVILLDTRHVFAYSRSLAGSVTVNLDLVGSSGSYSFALFILKKCGMMQDGSLCQPNVDFPVETKANLRRWCTRCV